MNKQLQADLMLLFVAFSWGVSYYFTKVALAEIQEFNLIALRFSIAFLLSGAVFYKKILKSNLKVIKNAFALATLLFLAYICFTFSLRYTTTANSAFLTSLAVVLVPIFSWVFFRDKLEKSVLTGVFFALVGITLLAINGKINVNYGDIIAFFCAVFSALHLIFTGKLTKEVDSITLGVFQIGFVAVFSTVFSFIFETPKLPSALQTQMFILFLSIFCTGVAFIIQMIAQKYTSPSHVGLIYSLEPVFAAIFGLLFLGEILSLKGYIGCLFMLLGILTAELSVEKYFAEIVLLKKINQRWKLLSRKQ